MAPSSSRHSANFCPERSSCAARQTTSGRSPDPGTNSKSCSQISSNGRSITVTRRPFLEQRVIGRVEQMAFVAECQLEDLGIRQFGPDWIRKPARWRLEYAVT